MTRAEHRRRMPTWIAAALAFTVMAGWAFADARVPYDDRPPLLASEQAPAGAEPASRLQDVGVADAQRTDALDVLLEADGGLPYEVFELSGPDRLVVDLPGVSSADLAGLRREVDRSGLVRVRVGQFRSEPVPVARVVLDMTEPLAWTIDRVDRGVRVRVAADQASLEPVNEAPADAPNRDVASTAEPEAATEARDQAPAASPETTDAEPAELAAVEPTEAASPPEPAPSQKAEPTDGVTGGHGTAAVESPETIPQSLADRPEPTPASETAPEPLRRKRGGRAVPGRDPAPAERAEPEPAAQVSSAPEVPEERPVAASQRVSGDSGTGSTAETETPSPSRFGAPSDGARTGQSGAATDEAGGAAASDPSAQLASDPPADKVSREPASQPAPAEPVAEDPWAEGEISEVIEEASGETRHAADTSPSVAQPALPGGNQEVRTAVPLPDAKTKTIDDARRVYTGERIDLQLVDADIKQVFGMFHEISGLNFVLDPAVGGLVTIAVDDVPWDQALDLILKNNGLDMVLEGNVVRIAPIQKLAQEAQARKQLHEAKELEEPPVTITRTLSYAKADEVEQVIRQGIVSEKGEVMVDERTNTLVIRDVPSRIKAIDGLLETLDSETPQVMIEARIVEISRDFVKDLGIRWGVNAVADPQLGTETNLDFPHRASGSFDLNLPRNPAASSLGFSFGNVLDSFTLDIVLDALETEGYARRLSSPKIATQNNEVAEIEQGVRIPVVSTTATEIDVRFVAASLLLRCTPQITADGTVILEVEVENNSPDFVNTVGEVPAINTQRAQTKVLISDGGTTVIGGIFTVNEGENETGVPWLRDLPGLGWLFRSKNVQTRNRELLIFITPRIIKAS